MKRRFGDRRFIYLLAILSIGINPIIFKLHTQGLEDSSISPKEERIKDFKDRLNSEKPNFPDEMHLFFQELKGDYAIFYDRDGRTVHYKYRRNKWDSESMESVHNLLSGRSYRVKGEFLGIYFYPKNVELRRIATQVFLPQGKDLTWEMKKEETSIPVYRLVSYEETYSDRIIFQSPKI